MNIFDAPISSTSNSQQKGVTSPNNAASSPPLQQHSPSQLPSPPLLPTNATGLPSPQTDNQTAPTSQEEPRPAPPTAIAQPSFAFTLNALPHKSNATISTQLNPQSTCPVTAPPTKPTVDINAQLDPQLLALSVQPEAPLFTQPASTPHSGFHALPAQASSSFAQALPTDTNVIQASRVSEVFHLYSLILHVY